MAKLSDDASGWSASGKKKKYDTQAADPQVPKPGSSKKKNTKKWCKGIEGRYHDVRSVQRVDFNEKCYKMIHNPGSYSWGSRRTDEWCGHYNHFETKCVGCGKPASRISSEPKRWKGVQTEQERLEEKWCDKGHLWDWEEFSLEDYNRSRYSINVVARQGAYMYQYKHWKTGKILWRTIRMDVAQYCVMCGKRSGRRKAVYPE